MAKKKAKKPLSQRQKDNRNPLYDPSTQLAGQRLKQAANALTTAELAPQVSALRSERADAQRQGSALVSRENRLYRDMAAREAAAVARSKAIQNRVSNDVRTANAEGAQALTSYGNQATQAAAQAERQTGVDIGSRGRLAAAVYAARAGQAGDARRASTDAALQSGNYAGLFRAEGGARQLHGAETRRELLNRMQTTRNQLSRRITDLKSTRGALTLKNLTTLRQSSFENAATVAGLKLKASDIQAQTLDAAARRRLAAKTAAEARRHNRALERNARRGQSIKVRGQDLTHRDKVRGQDLAHQDKVASRNRSRSKNREPQSSINLRTAIVSVQGDYERLLQRFHGDHARTARTIRQRAARSGKHLPEFVLVAAADLANFGYVTPGHVRALRDAGVHVPKRWTRRPRRSRAIKGIRFTL